MAEGYNLKSASAYINNLLLARGLLRNGASIEFAHPSRGEGGKEATMAQIINLVHDLILRRDREQDQRDTLTETIRTVRAESTRATLAAEKQQTRADDLARQLSLSASAERAARTALRAAEGAARSLRDEMARLKATVGQVRAACAHDVRRRDLQIQKLKSHLAAQQRGNRGGLVGASITITPGQTGVGAGSVRGDDEGPDPDAVGYSLRQETTEFLTQLSQSLSDENDNLIGLVRSSLVTLRELQGLPESVQMAAEAGAEAEVEDDSEENMAHALPTSYEALATDMDSVLESLRTLLTNPNFVPMDEVEMREEEIQKLREGWVKMETRWRETMTMMQRWMKRMMDGGDTVNLEELRLGLGLGAGFGAGGDAQEEYDEDQGMEDIEEASEPESSEIDADPPLPSPEKAVPDADPAIFDIKLKPDEAALKEANGNMRSPRKVAFPGHPDTPSQVPDENASEVDTVPASKPASARKRSVERGGQAERSAERPRQGRKRRSSPLPHADEPTAKMTVQEKLGTARAEADVASMAASLQAEPAKDRAAGSPRKTNVRGKARRRKSTLSPEELEALMGLVDE